MNEELKKQGKETLAFLKKHRVILLLLIPLCLSIFIRIQPAYLPMTDTWAESTVHDNIENSIMQELRKTYPTLPTDQLRLQAQKERDAFVAQNHEEVTRQIDSLASSFRSRLQDDTGQTYLLAIDPYYYAKYSENIIDHGHPGDTLVKDKPWDEKAIAPEGRAADVNLHSYVNAAIYKISSLFGNTNPLAAFFYTPLIIATLSIIPGFFIIRRFAGDIGATVGTTFLAVHTAFMTRTVAGFSDTDPYNVLLPLLISWLVLESFYHKKYQWYLLAGAGFFIGVYGKLWSGWWYIFDIILGAFGIYFLYLFLTKDKHYKQVFLQAIAFFISSLIFLGVFSKKTFLDGLWGGIYALIQFPLGVISLKDVATTTIWPNVFTTVAELNPVSLTQAISYLGGILFFVLVIAGMVWAFFSKKKHAIFYTSLFALWTILALYASTRGVRFTLVLVPAYALALGTFFGLLHHYAKKYFSKTMQLSPAIVGGLVIILAVLILISPVKAGYNQAINEVPSMNDAWWGVLENIKENSAEDAIITSWWDFGHWFNYVADRGVTFDGASQNREQAHFVGRILQTSDEKESLALLRMIDCGASGSYRLIANNTETQLEAVQLLQTIIMKDEAGARETLSVHLSEDLVEEVLSKTHCTPPEAFVIASGDMVGKASVWGHFGSWDFERAAMVQRTTSLNQPTGTALLQEDFNLTPEQATQTYQEIKNSDPNQWISPWPSFYNTWRACEQQEGKILCPFNIQGNNVLVTYQNNNAIVQGTNQQLSSVFIIGDEVKKISLEGNLPFSLMIKEGETPQGMLVHPLLSGSIFSRMYFYQDGLECYDLFDHRTQLTGDHIYVYRVNWSCLE